MELLKKKTDLLMVMNKEKVKQGVRFDGLLYICLELYIMMAYLRYLLKDNFPNDSNEEIEKKLRTLSNYDDSWYENIVLVEV